MGRWNGSTAGRSGRPFRRLQAQVYAEEQHCWLCGRWVDQDLGPQDPYGRSVDHLVQLSHHGPPLARVNTRLAHRRCNTRRGNQLRNLPRAHCACSLGQPCSRITSPQVKGHSRYTNSVPRVGEGGGVST